MLHRYTEANNKVVVATDTMKQTVYIMAKQHPVTPPELFGSIVASHFIDTYKHIHSAKVTVKVHRWTRLNVNEKPHPHSFYRDGSETRNVQAVADKGKGTTVRTCITGLLVLKSTGSAFNDFYRDEYTLLQDAFDRILSTEVDCGWVWNKFSSVKEVESAVPKFDKAWEAARKITLETFATESSPSVQNTLYKMCEQILEAVPQVASVDYSLPNKHYFEIGKSSRQFFTYAANMLQDLSWHKGLKNTGKDAEVYAPQSDPNGLIQCTVSR